MVALQLGGGLAARWWPCCSMVALLGGGPAARSGGGPAARSGGGPAARSGGGPS